MPFTGACDHALITFKLKHRDATAERLAEYAPERRGVLPPFRQP
ncbi:hypothetical protein ACI7BZ_13325 [Xanthobacter sp. AM11]